MFSVRKNWKKKIFFVAACSRRDWKKAGLRDFFLTLFDFPSTISFSSYTLYIFPNLRVATTYNTQEKCVRAFHLQFLFFLARSKREKWNKSLFGLCIWFKEIVHFVVFISNEVCRLLFSKKKIWIFQCNCKSYVRVFFFGNWSFIKQKLTVFLFLSVFFFEILLETSSKYIYC